MNVPGRAALGAAIAFALLACAHAHADPAAPADAQFDVSLLAGGSEQAVDLSRFERGNAVVPGVYRLDLYLAQQWSGVADVRFAAPTPGTAAVPCFTPALLDQLGLPQDKLSDAARAALADSDGCIALADLIPDATVTYDQAELRLDVTVPQAWLGYRARGYVGPEQWDTGATAALLNYNLNSYRTQSGGQSQTSGYLGVNVGLNVGAWRFRHDGSLSWQSAAAGNGSDRHWQSIATYARRDIPSWRAQITLGDSYTSGELFDSVGVRGVQLATDDRMLPDSLRGYAPTVRGVAETNARVTIRQNGALLYETTVTPGPFVIDDLYATGYGGDLNVSVTEADGRVREFAVPYASVPQQLRPGLYRVAVAVGRVHDQGLQDEPELLQATVQRGLTNTVTAYGGLLGSDGYSAALGGLSLNTRLGAMALDLTAARTQLPGADSTTGQSLRATYSKILPTTGTSFSLASYRYSTSGYYSLRDALLARDYANGALVNGDLNALDASQNLPGVLTPAQREALQGRRNADLLANPYGLERQRNRFDINLSQTLGEAGGSVYATASARDYWNRSGTDVQFQLGYSNSLRSLSYAVSANRVRDVDGRYSNQFYLSFSLPLGTSPRAPSLTASATRDDSGQTQGQVTLSGQAGVDGQFTYGASAAHGDDAGTSGSVNTGYRGSYTVLNASYGQGDGYSQASFGMAGAVVAHPGGVTFGQPAGDTLAIVQAPHATGARVISAPGVRINRFGYALVPYLTPYHINSVELDPKGVSLDVQLAATSARVAPYAGSVAMLRFETEYGRTALVRARTGDGRAVPFGAEGRDAQGRVLGIVGQGGRLLVRGADAQGTMTLSWQEEGEARQCRVSYRMPSSPQAAAATSDYPTLDVRCTPDAPSAVAAQ
ncbi:fimbria/pilus outer membrane usher protein [Lysobacter cavernae]|uniref:Fimbria/pilus outer membrane usher protein n=1 Tax=Lysobacter cavernae TaxID=1685901 RepID=A0ABV7RSC4_9GAMM